MKIVLPMLIMLVTGGFLGAGGATLLWSGMVTESQGRTKQVFEIADKWRSLAEKNAALVKTTQKGWNECLDMVKAR